MSTNEPEKENEQGGLHRSFSNSELQENSVIRSFRITAADGKNYSTKHYKLPTIIDEYTIKAYVMDDERIKSGGFILTEQYLEEQLQRIRAIRLSERKSYQKITDIYATAIDYDVTAQATKRFFATVQHKLHWAIHGQTAAEIIINRAGAENEMAQLSRLVNAYLDVAKDMALRKMPMTMQDWETRFNRFIAATDREILQNAGKIAAGIAKAHAESKFEKYRIMQDRLFESDFDRMLKQIEAIQKPVEGDE